MKRFLFLAVLAVFACKNEKKVISPSANATSPSSPAQSVDLPLSPDQAFPGLFQQVQMERIFPDGKTFVDCTPNKPAAQILEAYSKLENKSGEKLKSFVLEHFTVPLAATDGFKSDQTKPVIEHINRLWPVLTRQADAGAATGTLIPLPKSYIVPGGRFREVYYWDSYFTLLGLQAAGQHDLVKNICDNFAHLIQTVGHIPNGNRSYYLSRSQPPFFSLMIRLQMQSAQSPEAAEAILLEYLPALEKEYQFWMRGQETLKEDFTATERVVQFPGGAKLNRYWDNVPNARPESYREDMESIRLSGRDSVTMCRHLKAGAESGWDYSSRWGADKTLKDLRTTEIAPVDLNSLMWHLEQILTEAYMAKRDTPNAELHARAARARRDLLNKYFYNAEKGFYMDFNFAQKNQTGIMSLAGMFPAYFGIQQTAENQRIAKALEANFLRPGGVVTTTNHTGQQWDAPNGWAPLQYVTIIGLRNVGAFPLANDIKARWMKVNEDVFKRTGKMLEKYNVEDITLESGGGEYPVQDGFGWSNGVYQALKLEKKSNF
jgi:alpha,alpha-trehalase